MTDPACGTGGFLLVARDLTAALAEFEAVATALEEQLGTAEIDEDALTAD